MLKKEHNEKDEIFEMAIDFRTDYFFSVYFQL